MPEARAIELESKTGANGIRRPYPAVARYPRGAPGRGVRHLLVQGLQGLPLAACLAGSPDQSDRADQMLVRAGWGGKGRVTCPVGLYKACGPLGAAGWLGWLAGGRPTG